VHSHAEQAGASLGSWRLHSLWGWAYGRLSLNRFFLLITPLVSPLAEAPVLHGEAFSYLVQPVGASIRLDCVVHGDPTPNIHWTKDGLPLPASRLRLLLHNGSLIILRTEARRGHPG
jgi:hypothetical protein